MNHKPNRLDVITDLKRSISASFSENGFKDGNAKMFLQKAEANLDKINLDKKTYSLVEKRLDKAKNSKQSVEKRREDVLMVSSII